MPFGPQAGGTGWPIALMGGGATGNQHQSSTLYASKLAQYRIATLRHYDHYGQGFGPLGWLTIRKTDLSSLTIPDAGRGVDQNNDNVIGMVEGSDRGHSRASGPSRSATRTGRR